MNTKLSKKIPMIIFVLLVIFSSILLGYILGTRAGYKKGRSFQYDIGLTSSGYNAYYETEPFIDKDFANNPDTALCYVQEAFNRRHSEMKDCLANSTCAEYIGSTKIGLSNYTAVSEKLTKIKIKEANCNKLRIQG